MTSFFTNMNGQRNPTILSGHGVHSFGNNVPERPWIKTIVGGKVFENITSRNRQVRRKRELVRELFAMANDDTE